MKIFLSVIVSILAISGLISAVILVRLNADVRKSAHSNESAGMACTEEDWGYRESACVNGKSTRTYQKLTACIGGVTKPAQQEAQCNTYTSIPQVTASIYPSQENYPYRGFGLNIYTLDLATVFDNRNTPQGEHNYQEMVEGVKKTGAKRIRVPNGWSCAWYNRVEQDHVLTRAQY